MFFSLGVSSVFCLPTLFAVGLSEIFFLLIVLIAPLFQAISAYYADKEKKNKAKLAAIEEIELEPPVKANKPKKKRNRQAYVNEFDAVLPVEVLEAESVNLDFQSSISRPTQAQLAPLEFKNGISAGISALNDNFPGSAAAPAAQTGENTLAAGIFKIFNDPVNVQQAILISEILRRPDEKNSSVYNFIQKY